MKCDPNQTKQFLSDGLFFFFFLRKGETDRINDVGDGLCGYV